MKKSLSIILLGILICGSAFAEAGTWTRKAKVNTVTLAWDPSPDTNVIGYNIYWGGAPGAYTNRVGFGNVTTCTVSNFVTQATYYFAATAFTADNLESEFSNEISYKIPGVRPPSLRSAQGTNIFVSITGQGEAYGLYAFERSTDLQHWEPWDFSQADSSGDFGLLELPLAGPAFYRSKTYPN